MKLAKVIGTVTLAKAHPTMLGAAFKLAVPLKEEDLAEIKELNFSDHPGNSEITSEEFVIYDVMGATEGQYVGVCEGREAVNPFYPEVKPVDAYCALILDKIYLK